jgi:hypothetical protein
MACSSSSRAPGALPTRRPSHAVAPASGPSTSCPPGPSPPAASLKDKNQRLKLEVGDLRAQLAQMEALQRTLPDRYKDSVCVQEYRFTALGQLY